MKRTLSIFLATLALGAAGPSLAQTSRTVEIYKSPYCGCCEKWSEHITKAGFRSRLTT